MGAVTGARGAGVRAAAVAALAVATLLAGLVVGPVAASGRTAFGTPSAAAHFGRSVDFSEPVTLASAPTRVEVLVDVPGGFGPEVSQVTSPASGGATTLRYSILLANGRLLPNTVITARWRVTYPDGTSDVGPPVSVTYADDRFAWRTRVGSIVRVHWYQGSDDFGRRALAIAEAGVAKAERLLGVTESQPVDFFVYADQAAFYDALGPGTRENVGGEAVAEIRTLFALITPDELDAGWVGIVIPHELTHLVFDTAVRNPYHFPPRWLNEGLAVYLAQGYDASDRDTVRSAVADGTLIPLDGLTGEFPTTRDQFYLAYAESVSSIDFFVRTYGQTALVALIRSYSTGLTDDEAFSAAIGLDTRAFNAAWFASLGAAPATRFGPQPAPPGPLPAGWSEALASSTAPAAGAGAPSPSLASGPETERPQPDGHGTNGGLSTQQAVVVALGLVAVALAAAGSLAVWSSRGPKRSAPPPPSPPSAPEGDPEPPVEPQP